MIEKIKPLLVIQNLDIEILKIQNNFRELPNKIFSLNNRINSEETKIKNLSQKISELESISTNLQDDIADIEDKVRANAEKVMRVKTKEELEALEKETGDLKRRKIEIEDNQIKAMEEIESCKKDSEVRNANFQEEILPMKDEISELEKELNDSKEEVGLLDDERAKLIKEVDKDFLKIYERLSSNNNPPIIAETRGEVCGHCNMKIPPQVYIKVLQSKEIVLTPCCKKILIPKIT
ncbi:hypothetical protein HOG00_05050 [bacterium]|nr:hypothetical protein [bacterium]